MPLNARQLAIAVWLGVLVAFCLLRRDLRRSVFGLLRLGLDPALLVPAVLSVAWVAGVVLGLRSVGLWSLSLLWDTLAFAFVGTTILVWRMNESKDYSRQFYGRIVWRSLGLSVLISAIGNNYTFSIYVELLLVPWLLLLGGMLGLAQASEEHANLRRPLEILISATGLAMLVRAFAGAVADYDGFLSILTVQSLLLLFALTAAYVPYLFLVRVWMTYDSALVPLRLGEKKAIRVRLYARAKVAVKFKLDLAKVERFRTTVAWQLRDCTTRAAVDAVLESDSEACA